MLPSSSLYLLLLISACLTACSPAQPDAAVTLAPAAPPRAATTPCPVASVGSTGNVTNKARHVPDEDDPCADSRGVGRH